MAAASRDFGAEGEDIVGGRHQRGPVDRRQPRHRLNAAAQRLLPLTLIVRTRVLHELPQFGECRTHGIRDRLHDGVTPGFVPRRHDHEQASAPMRSHRDRELYEHVYSGLGIRDSGFGIRDSGFVRGALISIDEHSRIPDPGSRTPHSGSRFTYQQRSEQRRTVGHRRRLLVDHLDAIALQHRNVDELGSLASAAMFDDDQARFDDFRDEAVRRYRLRRSPDAKLTVVIRDAEVNAGSLDGR
jgi:hypothetical protein